MKKVLAVLLAVMFVLSLSACGGKVKNFFCHPTDAQKTAAQVAKSLATAVLAAAGTLTGQPAIVAVSTTAMSTFDAVIANWCASDDEWQAALDALQKAKDVVMAEMTTTTKVVPAGLMQVDQTLTNLRRVKMGR